MQSSEADKLASQYSTLRVHQLPDTQRDYIRAVKKLAAFFAPSNCT